MNEYTEWLRIFFGSLPMKYMMTDTRWAWPIAESIHFIGLSLLIGTVGMFDLRLMGVGKQIAPAHLHRLIKFGVAGFIGNILTGICFLSAAPDQYIYTRAFRWKLVFLTVAGLNILVFYSAFFRKIRTLEAGLGRHWSGGEGLPLIKPVLCANWYDRQKHWCRPVVSL